MSFACTSIRTPRDAQGTEIIFDAVTLFGLYVFNSKVMILTSAQFYALIFPYKPCWHRIKLERVLIYSFKKLKKIESFKITEALSPAGNPERGSWLTQ